MYILWKMCALNVINCVHLWVQVPTQLMASWATEENDAEFNGRGTKSFDLEEQVSILDSIMETMNKLRRSNLILESSILRRERAKSELL